MYPIRTSSFEANERPTSIIKRFNLETQQGEYDEFINKLEEEGRKFTIEKNVEKIDHWVTVKVARMLEE